MLSATSMSSPLSKSSPSVNSAFNSNIKYSQIISSISDKVDSNAFDSEKMSQYMSLAKFSSGEKSRANSINSTMSTSTVTSNFHLRHAASTLASIVSGQVSILVLLSSHSIQ